MRLLLISAMCLAASAAAAQPANVNDCTLIKDPVELRNCILRFEGQQPAPPPVVTSDDPSPSPQTEAHADPVLPTGTRESGLDRAAPAATASRSGLGPLATQQAGQQASGGAARRKARDTLISIEQVEVPRNRAR